MRVNPLILFGIAFYGLGILLLLEMMLFNQSISNLSSLSGEQNGLHIVARWGSSLFYIVLFCLLYDLVRARRAVLMAPFLVFFCGLVLLLVGDVKWLQLSVSLFVLPVIHAAFFVLLAELRLSLRGEPASDLPIYMSFMAAMIFAAIPFLMPFLFTVMHLHTMGNLLAPGSVVLDLWGYHSLVYVGLLGFVPAATALVLIPLPKSSAHQLHDTFVTNLQGSLSQQRAAKHHALYIALLVLIGVIAGAQYLGTGTAVVENSAFGHLMSIGFYPIDAITNPICITLFGVLAYAFGVLRTLSLAALLMAIGFLLSALIGTPMAALVGKKIVQAGGTAFFVLPILYFQTWIPGRIGLSSALPILVASFAAAVFIPFSVSFGSFVTTISYEGQSFDLTSAFLLLYGSVMLAMVAWRLNRNKSAALP